MHPIVIFYDWMDEANAEEDVLVGDGIAEATHIKL